jgi:hypothetical protein
MSQSLEWRLARTFVRCYSLVLLINFSHAIVGPMFGFRFVGYTSAGAIWDPGFLLATISTLGVWLTSIVILWFFSDKIANKLTGTQDSTTEGEQFDFPFDVAVGLAGLIFLVEGLKNLAGDAVAWYFSKNDSPLGSYRPPGVVDVRHLAVYSAEVILGLVLFVGAKSIVKGIMKLRGMPPATEEGDAV